MAAAKILQDHEKSGNVESVLKEAGRPCKLIPMCFRFISSLLDEKTRKSVAGVLNEVKEV